MAHEACHEKERMSVLRTGIIFAGKSIGRSWDVTLMVFVVGT